MSVALLLLLLLTGCSAGNDAGSMGASDADLPTSEGGAAAGGAADSKAMRPQRGAPGQGDVGRAAVQTRAVIKTGHISVTRKDLTAARRELDRLLVALGGSVDSEETSSDRDGDVERSTLVLRVPVGNFTAAMDAIGKLGTAKSASSRLEDVTTEVIDVEERVQTLTNSLDRLQQFQRRSSDINDLIRFEREITARSAELRSLQAQGDYLRDQTSMATINLTLSTPETYVAPPKALEDAGFLSGLRAGWTALRNAFLIALTLLGAVLPFLVVIALVGVPVYVLLRSARRRRLVLAPTGDPTGGPAGASGGPEPH